MDDKTNFYIELGQESQTAEDYSVRVTFTGIPTKQAADKLAQQIVEFLSDGGWSARFN